jgi:hypothetical protein
MCPEPGDIGHLAQNWRVREQWLSKLIIGLPPFVPQCDVSVWNRGIKQLRQAGVTRWMCGNLGQRYFDFEEADTLYAGPEIWCMNRATQQALDAQGFARFTYSPEDHVLNIKATASAASFFTLFSLVPLFVSRIPPATDRDVAFTDSKGNRFFTFKRNRLFYLVGARPLCLTHRRDALHELGIRNFILDFRFCLPRAKYLHGILAFYRNKQKLEGSTLFNYKAGLK